MGSIISRKRKDGSIGYHAQVTIKRSGTIVHRETRTFDRRQAASAWLEKRETELAKPGAIERQNTPDPKLAVVIDRYIEDSIKEIGRTKAQVLATIKNYDIADLKCSDVTSERLVSFAKQLRLVITSVTSAQSSQLRGRLGAIRWTLKLWMMHWW